MMLYILQKRDEYTHSIAGNPAHLQCNIAKNKKFWKSQKRRDYVYNEYKKSPETLEDQNKQNTLTISQMKKSHFT